MSITNRQYRFYIFLFLCILCIDCYSQVKYKKTNKSDKHFRIGPLFGVQKANMFIKQNDLQYNSQSIFGLTGGILVDNSINESAGIQSGILYTQAGTNSYIYVNRLPVTTSIRLQYIQVPLYVKPKFDQGNFILHALFGGYAGYAIGGTEISTGIQKPSAITFSSQSEQLIQKRYDLGLAIGGGMEIKNIQISAFYHIGLKNLIPTPSITNNKNIGVSVAYMFGIK